MTDKQKYRDLCKRESSIPIFSKDWWLDAVCGEDNWDVVLVERGGEVVASFPYYMVKDKFGFKTIIMPKLTQTIGIWIKYPEGQKYTTKLSYEKEIFTVLIKGLPEFDSYLQNFHYTITNWLPFCWKDFEQTTRYTYVIENLSNLDSVFKDFKENIKTDIRKAEKKVQVYNEDHIENFYRINSMTFDRQNINIPYSFDFLKRLDESCVKNSCRKILFAKDEKDEVHAAVYIVWDDQSAYNLMTGGNPVLRNSGATSLLMWEAIKLASTVTKKFDFEGSMVEPIERFFRAFGAVQKPYFQIAKTNSKSLKLRYYIDSKFLKLKACIRGLVK